MSTALNIESFASRQLRHAGLFLLVFTVQFVVFEAALRIWGGSEATAAFQGLFQNDPVIGFRLKPHARTRFTTPEFDAEIAINGLGVRDDDEIEPKAPNERRIVVLGDSLVLSVQVAFGDTFCELLEKRLNAKSAGTRYRVINAGVQGYGPVEQLLFFRQIAAAVEPDLVLAGIFVGNDAEEAVSSASKLEPGTERVTDSMRTRLRRLVRRSMVLQIFRLRAISVTDRFTPRLAPPEPPLQSYAAQPAPRIAEGLAITRRAVGEIVAASEALRARAGIVLLPARFQVDDGDYGRLREAVSQAGGELIRDAATERFADALSPLGVPQFDLLPALRATLPGEDLFFQTTAHLTLHGHRVVAAALERFITERGLLAGTPRRPQP